MEVNGYGKSWKDDYNNNAKPYYDELAAELKRDYGLSSVGIYLAGAHNRETGRINEEVIDDLASWGNYPNLDFLGLSWYPKGGAGP